MNGARVMDPELLRRIQTLELRAREVADGVLTGVHHAPNRGRSLEFAEHKEYTPGDDIRRIDWKVYGKSDRLYVKEFEDDTNITAIILVDGSNSMSYRSDTARVEDNGPVPAKLDAARTMAGALAYLLLNQSDAVGLGVVGDGLREYLPPRARESHFHEVTRRLAALEPVPATDTAKALAELVPLVKGRAMILVFSDLLDEPEPLLKSLRLMRRRRHELAVFHVQDPDEADFPFERLSIFQDLEGPLRLMVDPRAIREEYRRLMDEYVARVKSECAAHGIDFWPAPTDRSPARVLSSWLAFRGASSVGRGGR